MDKFRVLIVEDEAIVSMALRRKLEAMGYTVPAEISSGEDVVDAVKWTASTPPKKFNVSSNFQWCISAAILMRIR